MLRKLLFIWLFSAFFIFSIFPTKNVQADTSLGTVTVSLDTSANYVIGQNYNLTWSSSCPGGSASVWLTAPFDNKEILFPLMPLRFSMALAGADAQYVFPNSVNFNSLGAQTENNGSLSWQVPSRLNLSSFDFNNNFAETYYIIRENDSRYVISEKASEPTTLSVGEGGYRIRVIVEGAGCRATGLSPEFNVVKGGSIDIPKPPAKFSGKCLDAGGNSLETAAVALRNQKCAVYNLGNNISATSCNADTGFWCFDYRLGASSAMSCVVDLADAKVSAGFNCVPFDKLGPAAAVKSAPDNPAPKITPASVAVDQKLVERLKGRILLQIEAKGEAWYVNPKDGRRYYLADGGVAYQIMKNLGVGISNKDLARVKANADFRKKFIGKIFLQIESRGEAYYISANGRYNYLKDGAAAYQAMRNLGLGIKNIDLEKIPVASN